MTADPKDRQPLAIRILAYYGIIFGVMYILVAVVSIVLAILDRSYKDIDKNFLIGLYGIPAVVFGLGFKNLKRWAWIGYSLFLLLVVILSLFNLKDSYRLAIGVISLVVLAALFLPAVKRHFFPA